MRYLIVLLIGVLGGTGLGLFADRSAQWRPVID